MNVPIITTNVSDSMIDIEGKYGIVTNCNSEDFALAIETFLEKGFVIKEAFDSQKYNQEILAKLDKVIGDEIEN